MFPLNMAVRCSLNKSETALRKVDGVKNILMSFLATCFVHKHLRNHRK